MKLVYRTISWFYDSVRTASNGETETIDCNSPRSLDKIHYRSLVAACSNSTDPFKLIQFIM